MINTVKLTISLQHCDNNIRVDQHTAHMVVVQCGDLREGQKHVLYSLLKLPEMHLTAVFVFCFARRYVQHA